MRLKTLALSAAFAAALLAGPAAAQLATNSNAPVDITADELETQNNACTSIWRGHAEALQDNARLRADVLTADFELKGNGGKSGASGCGNLVRMKADGSVYYVTPTQKVHGDNAVYEAANQTLTVTGNVVTVQGQNVLRGERLVVNTQTGQGQMETGVKGRNKPGRVRGVFYPQQQAQNTAGSGANPPAAGQKR